MARPFKNPSTLVRNWVHVSLTDDEFQKHKAAFDQAKRMISPDTQYVTNREAYMILVAHFLQSYVQEVTEVKNK